MQKEQNFTSISSLYKDFKPFLNKQITVNGWVRTIRDSKTFGFIELND
jgi:asparaginyl-tRNA synthetase